MSLFRALARDDRVLDSGQLDTHMLSTAWRRGGGAPRQDVVFDVLRCCLRADEHQLGVGNLTRSFFSLLQCSGQSYVEHWARGKGHLTRCWR